MNIIELCMVIICTFAKRENTLQEFELLVYEQACRTIEELLKNTRKEWRVEIDEFENY